jgi:N-glycosylase/DNA lyase
MDSKNILTEIDLKYIFKYLTSSSFRKLARKAKSPEIRKALIHINQSNDELAKAYKDAFGKDMKSARHLTPKDLVR